MGKEIPDKLSELFGMMAPDDGPQKLLESLVKADPEHLIGIYVDREGFFRVVCTKMDCSKIVGFLERAKMEIMDCWLDEDYPEPDADEDVDD